MPDCRCDTTGGPKNDQGFYRVADYWETNDDVRKLDGAVEIDATNMLKSLDKDHVMITRAKETTNRVWRSLKTPQEKRWGSVYVDQVTYDKHRLNQSQRSAQSNSKEEDKLISSKETARLLGIQPDTLSKWRQKGKGPRYQRYGRTIKYHESDVRAYMNEQDKK